MKYDSLIFDLDGTLWDATKGIAEAWNIIFKQQNIDGEVNIENVASVMGYTVEDIARVYMPNDINKGIELIKLCCKEELRYLNKDNVVFYKNLREVIGELSKKYKLCIVSNCMPGYIEKFLEISNLKQFFVDKENASTGLSKAENIRLVIKRNNLINSLYIGDTLKDYQAASGANIDFLQALYGFGDKVEGQNGIKNIEDLISYLNKKENFI